MDLSDFDFDESMPKIEYEDVPIQVPCSIQIGPRRFVVKDVGAWQHTDEGIFATGYWAEDPERPEKDLLIPLTSISYIDLDYDALEAFRKEAVDVEDGAPPTLS